jgi:hypothetical protein
MKTASRFLEYILVAVLLASITLTARADLPTKKVLTLERFSNQFTL